MHKSITIYTVYVTVPYEAPFQYKSFLDLEEARKHFAQVVKEQRYECEVFLIGPITLPDDPTYGPTMMHQHVDPYAANKIRKEIAELQSKLNQLESY